MPNDTILIEQPTYPFLDLTKRRRPQRKRLFNRRWPRPRSSNHGCPWIQKPAEKATVVLAHDPPKCVSGLAIRSCAGIIPTAAAFDSFWDSQIGGNLTRCWFLGEEQHRWVERLGSHDLI